MSEEEIIKNIEEDIFRFNDLIYFYETDNLYEWIDVEKVREKLKTYQGILDLYNKEKEKNKELEKYRGLYENEMLGYIAGYEDGKHHKLTATAIFAEENKQKRLEQMIKQNYISKDKIKNIIKQLEKEQEQNRKELERGIDYLSNTMTESASKKIGINLSIREYLQELLEERK